ncbi:hypothetical protein C8P63_101133 [Melghirimyces profundicolus]|uniref:Uncharacterized protein n=1 Tax=Melghirimyces profundicolus TaxID=1242148 RepID=A0A2T6C9F2_9BACL|nr:hypothetical protein C8P63_101133 [Melghirimyces profundicolus]
MLTPVLLASLCLSLFGPILTEVGLTGWKTAYAGESFPSVLGDYAGELREPRPRKDGIRHVDTTRMVRKLKELGVNTYVYLVWHASTDWDDLRKEFLPAARKAGIDVWVYLVPPSEARSKQSEPFGTDYIAWFRAIGKLSQSHPNLKGVVMDDFNHNLSFFSPEYVSAMRKAGREMNPRLKFFPQIYYSAIRPELLQKYRSLMDGVVMTFRDGKFRNTQRTRELKKQIRHTSDMLKKEGLPFILMIHASKLSATPSNPSVRYVQTSMRVGLDHLRKGDIQGLITYVLQKEWFPERKDRTAYSGFGYGCLFVPPGHTPSPGDQGEIQQQIRTDGSDQYSLDLHHLSVHPRNLKKGQYVKQVLIDDKVVWEKDVRSRRPETWEKEHLNLAPYLKGKTVAVLTLRLQRKKEGTPVWFFTGFDQLEPKGFEVTNPGFEEDAGWSYRSNHPGIIGETLVFDPKRRLRVYLTAMEMFALYHLWEDIKGSGSDPLRKDAEQLFQSVVENRNEQSGHRLDRLIRRLESDSTLDPKQRNRILQQAKKLDHLLVIHP